MDINAAPLLFTVYKGIINVLHAGTIGIPSFNVTPKINFTQYDIERCAVHYVANFR